jgi:maltose/moltooligosaccharide transporter
MGIFNFFIVIPEIVASFTFGPIIKAVFGENSTVAPLYVVMTGGFFMLVAAVCVLFVKDPGDTTVPVSADEEEPLTIQGSAQPVPSSGLIE